MSDDEDDAAASISRPSGDDDDDDNDSSEEEEIAGRKRKKTSSSKKKSGEKKLKKKSKKDKLRRKKKKAKLEDGDDNDDDDDDGPSGGFIDDAAVLSGEEDDDEDEDDDENLDDNDYVRDGFVVDEDEEIEKVKRTKDAGDLEDSDDDDHGDDSDDDGGDDGGEKRKIKKTKKLKKIRDVDRLDEEDLELINEARGLPTASELARRREAEERAYEEEERRKRNKGTVTATSEAELRKGLFHESDDDDDDDEDKKARQRQRQQQRKKKVEVERYDEDAMDDFIDDDIGDQADIRAADLAADRRPGRPMDYDDEDGGVGVSEAQLTEASEIFGTDYLDFMGADEGGDDGGREDDMDDFDDDVGRKARRRKKFRERGVGVDYGVDSDKEGDDEDESDDSDDDDELFGDDLGDDDDLGDRQRAEALRLRREKRKMAKAERRRKAQEKRAERRKARLRRAFEPVQLVENFCTERDDDIRIKDAPERYYDWAGASSDRPIPAETDDIGDDEEEEAMWIMGRIPEIASEFFTVPEIKAEDADGMTTKEEEGEGGQAAAIERRQRSVLDSIIHALRYMRRDKLEPEFIKRYRVDVVTSPAVRSRLYDIMDEDAEWDRMTASRSKVETLLGRVAEEVKDEEVRGADEEQLARLQEEARAAEERLEETLKEEEKVKVELQELTGGEDDDDDDDELFGKDDDDDDDDDDEAKAAKNKQKSSLQSHLGTIQALLTERSERVAQLQNSLSAAENANSSSSGSQSAAVAMGKKMCLSMMLNAADYGQYLSSLTEHRHVTDVNGYLNLIKEGNEAIRSKSALPGAGNAASDDKKKRSRRFDRDYYRTCVSEGLRSISYKFVLPPFRAGIKLEDTLTLADGFSFDRTLPGENDAADGSVGDPTKWSPPKVLNSPFDFASELVGSGELVFLSSMQGDDLDASNPELKDPLRGCRYVAAMELAYEPRIRRHLRSIYRANAVLTTRPTSKGMENIDAFHEYYGLHLLRDKPVKEHFPMDERESEQRKAGLSLEERKEVDEELKRRETNSCIQYLNVLKAENSGDINVQVHLPMLNQMDNEKDPWYKKSPESVKSREDQDLAPLMNELERVYLPPDGDTDDWNEERRKILRTALTTFLLPQFEVETRRDLREASIKVGIESAAKNLHDMAMEGPYRPSHLLGENRFLVPTGDLPIVGVCCASDQKEASYLASVNNRGEMNDHLAVPGGTRVDDDKMREKVISFLMQTRPAAVVVGTGGGLSSKMLARKLGELITQATERWNNRFIQGQDEDDDEFEARMAEFQKIHPESDEDEDSQWKCNVDIVDDSVAQLFGRSVRGKKEFPDMQVNLKVAVATARHAQDPLGELTYTWSVASDAGVFGTEMLFLNIYPLQRLLPKPLLLRQYERVLCGAVAEVGVDINAACTYDHTHGMLSFIPGLGPRKAANLKQSIIRIGGVVASRRDLLAKRLMGPIVYNNAVAFLRIRETDQLENQLLQPLDDTRLHPDVYNRNNWAVKIAIDALELGESAANDDKDDFTITALRDVMNDSRNEVQRLFDATKAEWEALYGPTFNIAAWDPRSDVPAESWRDKVEELDLETFAQMIEQSNMGKWLTHLIMIKWELRLPFVDPRKPMEPLAGDKLFRLLTGESDETLRPGKEVTGKVVRNGDFGSRVKLEGDVPGFIPLRNLSDDHVEAAEDIVSVGAVVTAIVTEVKKDHLTVDMSLKMEDFRKKPSEWERPKSLPQLDLHFDRAAALKIEQDKSKDREAHLAALQLSMGGTKIGDDAQDNMDVSGNSASMQPARRTGRVTRRACAHPAFRNARHDEIDRELRENSDAMAGEALIRPSNKSCDSLAVHWMVRPGCIKVIEVREEDKDTDASIGNILKIKNEVYGSIDELLGRYIAPMNDRVEEVQHHRKFLDMLEDDMDTKLRGMKRATPSGIFYYLCWSEQHPGYASLRFIMSSTPRNHHIGLSPDGFVWGSKTYSSLDRLLNDFKKNPRGPGGKSTSRSSASVDSSRAGTVPQRTESSRPSRWGARSTTSAASIGSRSGFGAPPPPAAPPVTVTAQSGWGAPAADAGPPPVTTGWGRPSPPSRPPPPSMPPPPQNFQPPPPSGPPPSFAYPPNMPPPPQGFRPPPPHGGPPNYPPQVQP